MDIVETPYYGVSTAADAVYDVSTGAYSIIGLINSAVYGVSSIFISLF